jgi:threonyl-tRNA synthetase
VRVIPVGLDHRDAAEALAEKLGEFRVEVDDSDETVGKRIRNAEVEKIPYVVVWGDKESEDSIAVRTHGGDQSTKSLDELLSELRDAATV